MKTISRIITKKALVKITLIFAFTLVSGMLFSQGGTHPGMDPEGMSVPIDGGILMALLAGGGLVTMLFKKKKKQE
jgi:hypothetical protein